MPLRFFICDMMRPLIRAAPIGQLTLLRMCGGWDQADRSWRSAPRRHRRFFDSSVGAYFTADLADWSQRWHYYLGRYHEQNNCWLIRRFLRPGDSFIDIGANVGVFTLCASRVVGPAGIVVAIEPHPATFRILKGHIELNSRANCRLLNVGLSDRPDRLLLSGSDHSGTFTFRSQPDAASRLEVPVVRGDECACRYRPARTHPHQDRCGGI